MALKQTSLAEVLEKTSGTSYFPTFVQLVGKTQELVLYKGIDESYEPLIEELEDELGVAISDNYLEFLQIMNGGFIAGMKLFSLDERENLDSLYHRNFETDVRKKIKLPNNVLIIGEYQGGIICFEGDEEGDGSFTLMDIYNRERLEFAFFEDLVTFRFYMRLLEGGKKKIEEKEKLKAARKKLHDQIVKENKERKKVSEKLMKGNLKRTSKAGLKTKKPKARKF